MIFLKHEENQILFIQNTIFHEIEMICILNFKVIYRKQCLTIKEQHKKRKKCSN